MKATKEELDFHRRIMARDDPIASNQLAVWLCPILIRKVQQHMHQPVDPTFLEEAVHDAILNYCENPSRYNPQRLSLESFLVMDAERDLRNKLAKEERRQKHHLSLTNLERTVDDEDILDEYQNLDAHMRMQELEALREKILASFSNPLDRNFAELILDGIRDAGPYIALLKLDGLPHQQQVQEVKRHKDRIKWQLRHRGGHINE